MGMTKKDFIALADAMRPVLTGTPEPQNYRVDIQRDYMIASLIEFMYAQNPKFKEQRWRDYLEGVCGPNGGKING